MLVSILLPILSKKVYAAPEDLTSQLMKEAKQFTVVNALQGCITDKDGRGFVPTMNDGELPNNVHIFSSHDSGLVGQHVKPSDGVGICEDGNWVSSALSVLGVTDKTKFVEEFFNKINNGWTLKEEYQFDENGLKKHPELTADAYHAFLSAVSNTNNSSVTCAPRTGCHIKPLSDSARYLLLLRNFIVGCSAVPASLNIDQLNSSNKDFRTIYIVDASGNANPVLYEIKKSAESNVTVGAGVTDDGKYTCNTLAMQINQYSIPYSNKVKEALGNNQAIGDIGAVLTSQTKPTKQSCGQKTKLWSGWIICAGMNLLSSGMDKILDQVDNMLNVDVVEKDIANGGDLKKSWSSFRAIASFMLLAIGLVMILSQALGGDK